MFATLRIALPPLFAALLLLACTLPAQQNAAMQGSVLRDIDPGLAALIARTPAIDDHAHVVLPPPNSATDRDFDALPVDNMEPQTDPTAWRADNPQLIAAWKALWGFQAATLPLNAVDMKRLQAARDAVKTREGAHYDLWLLDQAGIGTVVANRVAVDSSIPPPRVRWVPYADALLFPFNNAGQMAGSPDRKLFFPMEDRLRARYMAALHLDKMPPTLTGYLSAVVTPTLERQHAQGAIAEKFEIAYLRGFDFTDPTQAQAEQAYAALFSSPAPDAAQYKLLQDFLFRYIAAECGRLGMAVHLHTMAGGGAYFSIAGDNPLLLEPVFNDPRLRRTNFVMLHGGWPYVHEAGALLQKPNVYLDLSQESLTFSPRTLSTWLREWLELYPEKVLFGTDGYPYSDGMGWEESTWIAARNARQALGLALTGMLQDGEISRTRAEEIAVLVLRGNAASLYRLP